MRCYHAVAINAPPWDQVRPWVLACASTIRDHVHHVMTVRWPEDNPGEVNHHVYTPGDLKVSDFTDTSPELLEGRLLKLMHHLGYGVTMPRVGLLRVNFGSHDSVTWTDHQIADLVDRFAEGYTDVELIFHPHQSALIRRLLLTNDHLRTITYTVHHPPGLFDCALRRGRIASSGTVINGVSVPFYAGSMRSTFADSLCAVLRYSSDPGNAIAAGIVTVRLSADFTELRNLTDPAPLREVLNASGVTSRVRSDHDSLRIVTHNGSMKTDFCFERDTADDMTRLRIITEEMTDREFSVWKEADDRRVANRRKADQKKRAAASRRETASVETHSLRHEPCRRCRRGL